MAALDLKQYDRQIRLWGLAAQQRMSESRILVFGLRGLPAEICKNLALAGGPWDEEHGQCAVPFMYVCAADCTVVHLQVLGALLLWTMRS